MRPRALLAFFALAYGISWLIWAPLWLPALGVTGLPVLPFQHALGALGPITAAFILAWREPSTTGVADLLKRMAMWRGRLSWILLALLTPYALLAISILVGSRFGETQSGDLAGSFNGFGVSREFPQFSAATFLVYNIVSFGYGEEVGWRGFALPRLQARYSALVSTLILSIGWALWHIPLFLYRPGYTGMNAAGIAGWFFSLVTGAILLTWLYNSSRGSLLAVAVFHATVDVAFTSRTSTPFVVSVLGAFITIWGVVVLAAARPRFWASPQTRTPDTATV